MIRFEIMGRLPGLNEMTAANRYNRFAGGTQKKKTTALCAKWIQSSKVPTFNQPIKVAFEWVEPNARRDIDNVAAGAKFVLDALVDTGRLPNDGRKWVRAISHTFPEPDPVNPKVIVTIEEA